ncbi:MAG: pyrimidine reductase family protein [Nocardioidaceae bacterium]
MQLLLPPGSGELSYDDVVELYDYPPQRPWIRANFVSTLDGAVQGTDSKAGSLSSPADKRILGVLRSLADVVVIGANTARVEDYQPVKSTDRRTTIRRRLGLSAGPAMAVVSRSLDIDWSLLVGGQGRTLVLTTQSASADKRRAISAANEVIIAGEDDVDFSRAVDELADRGYERVLCEGGPTLMHDVIASGRLDELCLTLTTRLVSGRALRLTNGEVLDPPYALRLTQLIEQDGELFARYTRA